MELPTVTKAKLLNDDFMALQAYTLLLDGKPRNYYESLSIHVMKTPLKSFNRDMKVDLLPDQISLYQLTGRAIGMMLNHFRESAGITKPWLYMGPTLTHATFYSKTWKFPSSNINIGLPIKKVI